MTRTLQPRTSARDEQSRRAQARRQLLAPGPGNPAERAGRQDAAALQLDAQVGVPRFLSVQSGMVQDPLARGQVERAPGGAGGAVPSVQVVAADQVGQSTPAGTTPAAPAPPAVPTTAQEPAISPAPASQTPAVDAAAVGAPAVTTGVQG
ncbi:MAG: hypothetical protein DCF26_18290, partial [Burkholderiales bacterium]